MVMETEKSYSFLKGIENKLGIWVDEGEARQHNSTDSSEIRPWGANLMKIWAGGAATDFAYKCGHAVAVVAPEPEEQEEATPSSALRQTALSRHMNAFVS